ncbi:hypothetical protein [Iodobacter fluviatilis]|uniref:Uncharacterized protein n=1 Tax=Iodobacter fluviatilis TaxID=537 RepID=A0A377Q3Y3_9NEIS|nr:hypothetical protein [Iodobacter fluviatilis]TCU90448.1 hypothetical protein EV682_101481 [Iodobacter fluviatilis]STQ89475.1 Uncharacterised protein [Iodobacter fluviatilis]
MQPFSSPEKYALLSSLSDLESGSVRQWFFLELAATETKGPRTKRARCWMVLLARLGPALLAPSLIQRGLHGAALYLPASQHRFQLIRQSLNDALLLGVSLITLLAGFNRLTASMQFSLWLLAITGAAWQIWRTRITQPTEPENTLPGAEASLGLYGILIAKELEPALALSLIKGLRQDINTHLAALQNQLPELAPSSTSRYAKAFKASSWLLSLIPSTWLLGILPAAWGWIVCCLLLIGLSYLINRHWQTPALLALSGLCVYALAKLAHWL